MARASDQTAVTQVLERQIRELERASDSEAAREEIERLRHQLDSLRQPGWQAVADAWSRVLLARHPQRPYTLDYIQMLFTDFMGLHEIGRAHV